jgi:hypothetical protein
MTGILHPPLEAGSLCTTETVVFEGFHIWFSDEGTHLFTARGGVVPIASHGYVHLGITIIVPRTIRLKI